jgi:hypothetical protein
MHDVLLSLVAAFMPAAWMPYSKQLLAVDALRAQVDRCQHCWQPMCEDSTDRPVRMLQPCGHAIHVDCARARAATAGAHVSALQRVEQHERQVRRPVAAARHARLLLAPPKFES